MGSLAFVQPAFLFALAAIAVPILIHLIHRKKAVRWRFAAMEFLLRSHRKVARRLKMKQLILLLLRCLLFAAVAMAFARPFLRRAQGSNPSKSRAMVLIVDDSLSMQLTPEGSKESLFTTARKRAQLLLNRLRGEDQVALLHGSAARTPQPHEQLELTYDKRSVVRKLDRWKPTYRSTDLVGAMRRAAAIVEKVKAAQPMIVLLSDFAQHAFAEGRMPKLNTLPPIELIPIRGKKAPSNHAIIGLTTEPAPFAAANAYQFTVTIQNFSKQATKELSVQLKLGKRPLAKGFVKIAAMGTAQKNFIVRLPRAGMYTGSVELGADQLAADNKYYFALQARQRPQVLLVNGDPRTIPYLDELFYVERALRDATSPFVLKSIHASATLPDPSKYQAIFLVNVGALPNAWMTQLRQFVRKGGGLLMAMGNQVEPTPFNLQFEGLLPRPLRHVALAAQRPDGTGIALQRYFGEVSASHPIFQPLYNDGLVFQSARVSRLMLVQTRKSKQGGNVLWRFSHGPPALLERKVGRGRSLLLTTTLDRDWTDLCIRPFFQPWLKQVTTYLAGGSRFQQRPSLEIDQPTRLAIPGNASVTVKQPDGRTSVLRPAARGFSFPGGDRPGIYSFSRGGKKLGTLPVIVNVPSKTESDLTYMNAKQLGAIGSLNAQASALALQQSERLWPFFFLFLLLIFLAEAAILRFM